MRTMAHPDGYQINLFGNALLLFPYRVSREVFLVF